MEVRIELEVSCMQSNLPQLATDWKLRQYRRAYVHPLDVAATRNRALPRENHQRYAHTSDRSANDRVSNGVCRSTCIASGCRFRTRAALLGCLAGLVCAACGEDVHVHLLAPEEATSEVVTSPPTSTAPAPSTATPLEAGAGPIPDEVDAGAASVPDDFDAGSGFVPDEVVTAPPVIDAGGAAARDAAPPTPLSDSLLHHYDFSGTGTTVVDLVGGADGEVIGGAELDGVGGLTLDGVDDYVDLPNGLVSSLEEVTLAMWLVWHGGPCWQRLFDIGTSTDGEDVVGYAETSIFVTPSSCSEAHVGPVQQNALTFEFHVRGVVYLGQHEAPLPQDQAVHVALTIDPEIGVTLYVDGQQATHVPALVNLDDIVDDNAWLGRSQWEVDALLAARLDDFRIYDAALSGEQMSELFALGPDGTSAP